MTSFEHEGWKVTLVDGVLRVQAPSEDVDVDTCGEGLYVFGGHDGGNPFLRAEAVAVTIPWPVLEAILEAWREQNP
jgi:hypothetical protein